MLSEYVNSDFIIGSAAEAERLWSEARNVLTAIRSSMAPATFKAIMLLKKNPTFWDGKLTARAYNIVKDEGKAMREKGIKKANEQEKEGDMIEVLSSSSSSSSSSSCSDSDSDSESS